MTSSGPPNAPSRNGGAHLPSDVNTLREEVRRTNLQLRLQHLRQRQRMMESLSLWRDDFASGDYWVGLRTQGDGVANGFFLPPTIPSDRRRGDNWPLWRTESELDRLRMRSRILCDSNAYAKGILGNLCNYVIGKGFAYKAQAKDVVDVDKSRAGIQLSEPLKKLVRRTQDVIDRFLKLNRWNGATDPRKILVASTTKEREGLRRVVRDGDAVLRFYYEPNGDTFVRMIGAELLRNPAGGSPAAGWSYGIRHQTVPFEDVEVPVEYHIAWHDLMSAGGGADTTPTGEFVEATHILHLKGPDTDSDIKRGLPYFSYDVAAACERAATLQRNLSMGAAIRAATAEIWQHNATAAQVGAYASGLAEFTTTNPVSGKTEQYERIAPGTIRRIPAGQELVPPVNDQSTVAYIQGAQGDLRQACAAFNAPEYWSADASNGNYASTQTATAPTVLMAVTWQEYFKAAYGAAVWKAVAWAVRCGLLPKEALTLVDIVVDAPSILYKDELSDTQQKEIELRNGVISPQEWCAARGRDYEITQANNEEHAERTGGGQGGGPPIPGGEGGDGGDDGADAAASDSAGADNPPAPRQPPQAAAESFRECDGDALCPHCGKRAHVAECGGDGGKPGPCPKGGGKDGSKDGKKDSKKDAKKDSNPSDKQSLSAKRDAAEKAYGDAIRAHADATADMDMANLAYIDAKDSGDGAKVAAAKKALDAAATKEKAAKAAAADAKAKHDAAVDAHEKADEKGGKGGKNAKDVSAAKDAAAKSAPSFPADDAPRQRSEADMAKMGGALGHTTQHLDAGGKAAVRAFLSDDYESIQAEVRSSIPGKHAATIAAMDRAMAEAPVLKEPVATYRGMHMSGEDFAKFSSQIEAAIKGGGHVEMPGFSSTSLDYKVASNFASAGPNRQSVVMEIAAKHGMYTHGLSDFEEKEFTLPRNAKLRPIGYKEVPLGNGKTQRILQMEQVV